MVLWNVFLIDTLPLASMAMDCDIVPLFPALEPGGNFWDTAFSLYRYYLFPVVIVMTLWKNLVLSSYAWTHDKTLNWGSGGPERWTDAVLTLLHPGEQDQLGFRTYEWYLANAAMFIQKTGSRFSFGAGVPIGPKI
jgi:hypothetical protein